MPPTKGEDNKLEPVKPTRIRDSSLMTQEDKIQALIDFSRPRPPLQLSVQAKEFVPKNGTINQAPLTDEADIAKLYKAYQPPSPRKTLEIVANKEDKVAHPLPALAELESELTPKVIRHRLVDISHTTTNMQRQLTRFFELSVTQHGKTTEQYQALINEMELQYNQFLSSQTAMIKHQRDLKSHQMDLK